MSINNWNAKARPPDVLAGKALFFLNFKIFLGELSRGFTARESFMRSNPVLILTEIYGGYRVNDATVSRHWCYFYGCVSLNVLHNRGKAESLRFCTDLKLCNVSTCQEFTHLYVAGWTLKKRNLNKKTIQVYFICFVSETFYLLKVYHLTVNTVLILSKIRPYDFMKT